MRAKFLSGIKYVRFVHAIHAFKEPAKTAWTFLAKVQRFPYCFVRKTKIVRTAFIGNDHRFIARRTHVRIVFEAKHWYNGLRKKYDRNPVCHNPIGFFVIVPIYIYILYANQKITENLYFEDTRIQQNVSYAMEKCAYSKVEYTELYVYRSIIERQSRVNNVFATRAFYGSFEIQLVSIKNSVFSYLSKTLRRTHKLNIIYTEPRWRFRN